MLLTELRLELFIATRYLRARHRGASAIINRCAMIGITLGVATLIVVMSVMNGYETAIVNRILGLKGHLSITAHSGIENYRFVADALKNNIPEISYIAPIIEEQAMVMISNSKKNSFAGVMIRGVAQQDLLDKPIEKTLSDGSDLTPSLENGLIIGVGLMDELDSEINKNVKIITPSVEHLMIGPVPRMKTYKIAGWFDFGMFEYNQGLIFMSLPEAQCLFQLPNMVNTIEIALSDIAMVEEIKSSIKYELLKIVPEADLKNWFVSDWKMANSNLVAMLRVERTVMFFILSFIILIAAFNILSSLSIMVQDKRKSIAILKTIGMSNSAIVRVFIMCGTSIGVLGTAFGTVIGVLFAQYIDYIKIYLERVFATTLFDPVVYFLSALPSELSGRQILAIVFTSLTLSILVTIYPALRAARILPAQVLRYEIE